SIYQQMSRDREGQSLALSTLETWVIALMQWSLESGESVTLWLKGDAIAQWYAEIAPTHSLLPERLAVYQFAESPPSSEQTVGIFVPLQPGQIRRDEACFIALTSQGGVVLAIRWLTTTTETAVAYSFEPETIRQSMVILQNAVAIADDTVTTLTHPFLDELKTPNSEILTQLLQQYLNQSNDSIIQIEQQALSPSREQHFFEQGLQELSIALTRMKTALSLLHSPNLKARQRQRYLSLLQQECDRQNALICGIRLLTSLNTTNPRMPLYTLLEEVLPTIVSTYQPLASEKGIQLGYTLTPGLPPVACRPTWLRQIVIHLLNNSLQFTLAQGRVSVMAQPQGEQIQLTVKDTGIGIAKNEVHRIFDSFYRGRSTESEGSRGAGLGLTIVHQLVERCGGSITVNSRLDRGSVFQVLFPIYRETPLPLL
ncbi:MAG: HAMP domain-containing sensor histidine kinase, partial [Jaaginema sp. PMC 1079.18]|nr:HAMP domain-containing sensor histidine kinase [Jaaginema sp. PMC 1079.18]